MGNNINGMVCTEAGGICVRSRLNITIQIPVLTLFLQLSPSTWHLRVF